MAAELAIDTTGAVLEDVQALAHIWRSGMDPNTALCGKRIMGVDAPPDADVCIVCESLSMFNQLRT